MKNLAVNSLSIPKQHPIMAKIIITNRLHSDSSFWRIVPLIFHLIIRYRIFVRYKLFDIFNGIILNFSSYCVSSFYLVTKYYFKHVYFAIIIIIAYFIILMQYIVIFLYAHNYIYDNCHIIVLFYINISDSYIITYRLYYVNYFRHFFNVCLLNLT